MEADCKTLLELVQELSRLVATIEAKCSPAHASGNEDTEPNVGFRKECSVKFDLGPQEVTEPESHVAYVAKPSASNMSEPGSRVTSVTKLSASNMSEPGSHVASVARPSASNMSEPGSHVASVAHPSASNRSLIISQGLVDSRTPAGLMQGFKKSGSTFSSPSVDTSTTFDMNFRLHLPWEDKSAALDNARKNPTMRTNEISWAKLPHRDASRHEDSILQRFVISPTSGGKLVWDLVGITLISYEIVALPLQFFEPPRLNFMLVLAWLSPIYWFVDMCLSFIVAYHDSKYGDLEMRPSRIRRHYITSFLCVDALCVIVDVLSLATDNYTSREALIRLVKVLKLTRLFRIFKFEARLRGASKRLRLSYFPLSTNITSILLQVMLFCHYDACIWYGIGAIDDGTTFNWLDQHRVKHRSFLDRYLVCLHWALSHFAPSTTNIFPMNAAEHAYAVMTSLMAMVVFSSMVGNMTSKIVELREGRQKRRREEAEIAAYMVRHHVSSTTRAWIMQFVLSSARRATAQSDALNAELLLTLPDYLRNTLRFEVYCHGMRASPILESIVHSSPRRCERLCANGMSERPIELGSDLFIFGQRAVSMYIFTKGLLAYSFGDRATAQGFNIFVSQPSVSKEALTPPLQCGPDAGNKIAAECALWVTWTHRGHMVATTYAEYVAIDVKSFLVIMRHEALAWRYSHMMYTYLLECPEEACTDVIPNTNKLNEMAEAAHEMSCRPGLTSTPTIATNASEEEGSNVEHCNTIANL